MSTIVEKIFEQRGNFILIGLTGRTGSGCTKIADLLTSKTFEDFNAEYPSINNDSISNEDLKYNIVYNYMKDSWGEGFHHIKVRDIITSFVVEEDIEQLNIEDFKLLKQPTKDLYNKLNEVINKSKIEVGEAKGNDEYYSDLIIECKKESPNFLSHISELSLLIKQDLSNNNNRYTSAYQTIGDNIRNSGKASTSEASGNREISAIAYRINCYIKYLRKENKKTLVVIDAFRNPFEVFYFRERYAAFYLMAVNTSEEIRKSRLHKSGLDVNEIEEIDNREYPDKKSLEESYTSQNICKCIEISDIHLLNKDCKQGNFHQIKSQLLTYISLIKHPGLITPTSQERTMQIAYTAKFNSGCISRQVGAVVTGEDYSIKSIGWNDVPQGQTPCLLKNGIDLINGSNKGCYSDYELETNDFKTTLKSIHKNTDNLEGRNLSFCFKDTYNLLKMEKNQVHTRSLHAEENAFLQISKHGGMGVKGGKLFTTASPCELCAKKAYQLGIKDIFYIDIYPGISIPHILNNGKYRPTMHLFNGAIGRAYIQMYQPILSYKDELYNVLDFDYKEVFGKAQKK